MNKIWRSRFPIFQHHPELVYLDNAATTQRVDSVIDAMQEFSISENASIHRGIYNLSNAATNRFEDTRHKIAKFLNAKSGENIGFTKGSTESINVVAKGYLESRLSKDDNVVVSILEHHANFLPWQDVCKKKGAELRILRLDGDGKLSPESLAELVDKRTRLVAVNHISNALGRINPVTSLIAKCKKRNVPVLIDAAQSAALHSIDVEKMGCDFLVFSGHKMFGPMGTGVLYVGDNYREEVEPLVVGGGMIESVSESVSTYRPFPFNLDAGTPNVQGVLGLGAAVDFLTQLDKDAARLHVARLTSKFTQGVKSIAEIKLVPLFDEESGIVSFNVNGIHAHDVAGFLNRDNIAIRAGMHCTQPLLDELNLDATARVSFSIYNEEEEVDRLISSLQKLVDFWK
ncbi:MAG: cysteine desulfurase [Cyclobacteriaceae bacterium]|nr:cysteine desulfurase [Cyclobacteriaceae bacterium]